jgi:hypothetical protein
MTGSISRRDFLKYSTAGFGLVAIRPNINWLQPVADIPQGDRIGRICVGSVNMRSKPSADAPATRTILFSGTGISSGTCQPG